MQKVPQSQKLLSGDQKLAMAVLLQAVEDVTNPDIDLRTWLEATDFLEGERATMWCHLAGIDQRMLRSLSLASLRSFVH